MQESKKAIPEPNFFQCPNIIIDEYLKELSGSELKCFLFIVRKTKGWHKDVDAISISQFVESTGLSNRAVIDACNSLVGRGFIFQDIGERGVKLFTLDCKKFTSEKSSHVKKVHSTSEKTSQVPVKKVHKSPVKKVHTQNTLLNKDLNTLLKESCGDVANADTAAKKNGLTDEQKEANKATWEAYAGAYKNRYGVEPLRNAQVNGIISKFVKTVGQEFAPSIARYYINLNNQYYVTKLHDTKTMLADACAIHTQWLTRTSVSATQARQQDKEQAAKSAVDGVLERRAKRLAEAEAMNNANVIDGEFNHV